MSNANLQAVASDKGDYVARINNYVTKIVDLAGRYVVRTRRFPPTSCYEEINVAGGKIFAWNLPVNHSSRPVVLADDGHFYYLLSGNVGELFPLDFIEEDTKLSLRALDIKERELYELYAALKDSRFGYIEPPKPKKPDSSLEPGAHEGFFKRWYLFLRGYAIVFFIGMALLALGVFALYINYYPHQNV